MENLVLRIAEYQRKRGHDASVMALKGGPLCEEAARLRVPVKTLDFGHKALRVVSGAAYLKRLKADVVHAHNATSLHYALLGKKVGCTPVVMTCHGRLREDARIPTSAEWKALDAIIAVSETTRGQIASGEAAAKITVIHNGVEPANPDRSPASVRKELGLENTVIGIIVARIDNLKGHDTLVEALSQLQSQMAPITVLVVGDGAERQNIESLASARGLIPDYLRFLGFRSDIANLLAASDFFVLPSLTEGLPLSILEAMSHSLPIIATPVGGVPELVEDGKQGMLVPVKSTDALAKAMLTLARRAELRSQMGREGLATVQQEFSFDTMMDRYDNLYYSLIAGGAGIFN